MLDVATRFANGLNVTLTGFGFGATWRCTTRAFRLWTALAGRGRAVCRGWTTLGRTVGAGGV